MGRKVSLNKPLKNLNTRVSYGDIYHITEKLKIYKNEIIAKKMTCEDVAKMITEDLKTTKSITGQTIKKCWRAVFPDTPYPRQPAVYKEKRSGGSVYRKLRWECEKNQIIADALIKLMASFDLTKEIENLKNNLLEVEKQYKAGWK